MNQSKLDAFDIGWIPKGWTKGEPLWVYNIPPIMKHVNDKLVDIRTTISLIQQATVNCLGDEFSPDDVGIVTVGVAESEKCNKWLEWWRGEE